MTKPVIFKVKLTLKEYLSFRFLQVFRPKIILAITSAIFLIFILPLFYMFSSAKGVEATTRLIEASITALLTLTAAAIIFLISITFVIKKQYEILKSITGECIYTADEEKITAVSDDASLEFKWADLERVDDKKSSFIIWTIGKQAFCVPKRVFGTQAEAEEFLGLCRGNEK